MYFAKCWQMKGKLRSERFGEQQGHREDGGGAEYLGLQLVLVAVVVAPPGLQCSAAVCFEGS